MPEHYRADIDGLRAIAILWVVLFHAFPSSFPGGFVGVDIFFVISGYLITSILLRQNAHGSVKLGKFYLKRAIRLFPSLAVVLAAFLLFGYFCLLPHEFAQLGKHAAAGAGFIANISFFKESGYFDTEGELKPFLHLWSLGIEEQFYFVWPVTLMVLWRWRRSAIPFFLVVALLYSFGSNVRKTGLVQEAAFYLPQYRAWELLAGALLGWMEFRGRGLRWGNSWLSVIGLAVCVAAMAILTGQHPFPGAWALLPVVGTVALVAAGPNAWINRQVLSRPWLVHVGLISYPLYLWHWPLLSFEQIVHGTPQIGARSLIVAVSFLAAHATYRWVEIPFKGLKGARQTKAGLAITFTVLGLGGLGWGAHTGRLAPRSSSQNLTTYSDAAKDWDFPGKMRRISEEGTFHFTHGDNPRKTIFIGDSHIQQYWPRVERIIHDRRDANGALFYVGGGCPPIPGLKARNTRYNHCPHILEHAFPRAFLSDVHTVVLGGAWISYLAGIKDDIYTEGPDRGETNSFNNEKGYAVALARMAKMGQRLVASGKRVYLILPSPLGHEFDPSSMLKRTFIPPSVAFEPHSFSPTEFRSKHGKIIGMVRRAAEGTGMRLIDPVAVLCPQSHCPTATAAQEPLYKDDKHMRPFYARSRATYIDQTLVPD